MTIEWDRYFFGPERGEQRKSLPPMAVSRAVQFVNRLLGYGGRDLGSVAGCDRFALERRRVAERQYRSVAWLDGSIDFAMPDGSMRRFVLKKERQRGS